MSAPGRDDGSLEYEFDLEEPPDKVWRALIIPEIAATWMPPDEGESDRSKVGCQVVDIEPRRSVTYRWQPDDEPESYVTFELTPLRAGTRLRLTHTRALPIRGPVAMLTAA
jgi:uncharacterized protein YndB with AHSA1/START domain